MKPIVFYVDDEPHNLTVFEAALPDSWDIKVFDNPMKAIEALDNHAPSIIVSDQRMPAMSGVQFLELAKRLQPNAIRIIVTGYSDEELVVESVRKAQIFDYIKKPWDVDDLEASLQRALDFYNASQESRRLQKELEHRELELKERNLNLEKILKDLELAKKIESEMRSELECWVPPFVRWALQNPELKLPIKKNLVGITFDIIGSSAIHDKMFRGRPLRTHIIQAFSECVIRHGGWRESHSGDSAYAHFGLLTNDENSADAALTAAREFRTTLRGISELSSVQVECGIGLHIARNCTVDIHTVQLNTPQGTVTQKSFDTTSTDIDLLHRIEKLVHILPGSNIIMSADFVESLSQKPQGLFALGSHKLAGQAQAVDLFLIRSALATDEDLEKLKAPQQNPAA